MRSFSFLVLFLFLFCPISVLFSQQSSEINQLKYKQDSITVKYLHDFVVNNSINRKSFSKFPVKGLKNMASFYPGIFNYSNDFYYKSDNKNELSYSIEGISFNDLFNRSMIFNLPQDAIEQIDFHSGYLPMEASNAANGLFNYELRTGGEKLEISIENTSDNIGLSNNPFSGTKRLGAYWYGYNEFNASIGGPLFTDNLRFFVNFNNNFMRDNNPQAYPGFEGTYFSKLVWERIRDSLTFNLPAGPIPNNSSQKTNLISTISYRLNNIQVKLSGIYSFERNNVWANPVLTYFNSRKGLNDNKFGLLNIEFKHNLTDNLHYEVKAGYWQRKSEIYDPFLKDNYWAYGDSVANAQAGAVWGRNKYQIVAKDYGRFTLPTPYDLTYFYFSTPNLALVDYRKSEQSQASVSIKLNYLILNHDLSLGGSINIYTIRKWEFANQINLARYLQSYKMQTPNYTEQQCKDLLLSVSSVNNIGYDKFGNTAEDGYLSAPHPVFGSFYLNDSFIIDKSFNFDVGFRYDYIDYDYQQVTDITKPYDAFNQDLTPKLEKFSKIKPFHFFSPRIKTEIGINDSTSISLTYLTSIQNKDFSILYQSYNSLFRALNYTDASFTYDLSPDKVSEFDLGFRTVYRSLDIKFCFFYKAKKNLVNYAHEPYSNLIYRTTSPSDYALYQRGFDIKFGISGFGLNILSNVYYQDNLKIEPKTIINTLINYNFSNETIFNGFSISSLFKYSSGRTNNYPNRFTSQLSDCFQVDVRLSKSIYIMNNTSLDLYLYVINLFDKVNEIDITGVANYYDPSSLSYDIQQFGPDYLKIRKAIYYDYNPQKYAPPRQIGFGIKLNIN